MHSLTTEQLQHLTEIAIAAAQEAGRYIEQFDRTNLQEVFKDAGSSEASQIVTEVDIRSEEIIRLKLQEASNVYNIAFVGEESALGNSSEASERFKKPYFWCVDPLDGTLAFAKGQSGYAVSIALVDQSGTPLIGVVVDPVDQTLIHAIKGHGAYQNLLPLGSPNRGNDSLTVYADASFKTHERHRKSLVVLEACARTLNLDGVNFIYGNGAVKNACHVLKATHACYLKLPKKEEGGGSIWDFAATACIAQEAQGWASGVNGKPLKLNCQNSTFMKIRIKYLLFVKVLTRF